MVLSRVTERNVSGGVVVTDIDARLYFISVTVQEQGNFKWRLTNVFGYERRTFSFTNIKHELRFNIN